MPRKGWLILFIVVLDNEDFLPLPTPDDKERIERLLRVVGGRDVNWGAVNMLEVLIAEHRVRAERLASARLTRATWMLAVVTLVLALATVGLIVATISKG